MARAKVKDKSYILVEVGRLPGRIEEIALNGNRTVAAALKGAGLELEENEEIRVNNIVVDSDADAELEAGDVVTLIEDITGN